MFNETLVPVNKDHDKSEKKNPYKEKNRPQKFQIFAMSKRSQNAIRNNSPLNLGVMRNNGEKLSRKNSLILTR